MKRDHDIKAPDGFLLGGLRQVRSDGTILFQRGWWKAPDEWVGEKVWVHSINSGIGLEAAPPGQSIEAARYERTAVRCERTDRDDAKPGYRCADNKAWAARLSETPSNTVATPLDPASTPADPTSVGEVRGDRDGDGGVL